MADEDVERLDASEYGEGLRYDDTVLIGVSHFPMEGREFRVGICDAIAYNKAKDIYFKGVTSVASIGRPPLFPGVQQGSFVPDDDELRLVSNRDPSIGLWTETEVRSFPHAKGFYMSESIADLIEREATEKGIEPGLIYHGSNYLAPSNNDSKILIGFGEGGALVRMISSWYDLMSPAVDRVLSNMVRGQLDPEDAQEFVWHLLSMSVNPNKDTKRRIECAFRLLLTMDDDPETALEKWNVVTQYKTDMAENELQESLAQLRDKLGRC